MIMMAWFTMITLHPTEPSTRIVIGIALTNLSMSTLMPMLP